MTKQVISNQSELRAHLSTVWREPLEYPLSIEIKGHKPKRSLSQNGLYWVWMEALATCFSKKAPPYNSAQMHALMRHKFLGYEDKTIGSTEIKGQLISTTDLEAPAMSEYMMKIEAWGADHGCLLPVMACKAYETYREAAQ